MDFILQSAKKFASIYFSNPTKYEELLSAATDQLYTIDDQLDKIKFVTFLLERNNSDYQAHLLKCTEPDTCRYNYAYEHIRYFLNQELNSLGVKLDEDTFTEEEKKATESKLDQILADLAKLQTGQQIIYEDLTKEINELRELYFLGKKTWYQLLIGKSVEMVASGIVSETVSRQMVESIKMTFQQLTA